MDHCTQTADGLATWIERRQHTPAELRQILRLALQDAEARGARLANLEGPADPRAEPARPLNAHVGRRIPVVRLVEEATPTPKRRPLVRKVG